MAAVGAERVGLVHTSRLDTIELLVTPGQQLVVRAWDERMGARAEIVLSVNDAVKLSWLTGDAMAQLDRLVHAAPAAVEALEAPAADRPSHDLVERAQQLAGRLPA